MFPTRQELSQIVENEETAITFFLNKNIISRPTVCSVCLNLNISGKKKKCGNVRKKIFRSSFFQNTKPKLNKLLEFSYYWLAGIKRKQTAMITGHHNVNLLYGHLPANHSVEFVDSETGVCTNTIEGTWNALKYKIPHKNSANSINEDEEIEDHLLDDFLKEFQLR
ncbi:hypothetical protein HZS_3797 [Henneguya salminicola]|nr:hypothetical protein HZS_3797 [Henneguya salminicola]